VVEFSRRRGEFIRRLLCEFFSSGSPAVLLMNRQRWTPKDPWGFPSHPHGWFGFGRLFSMLYCGLPSVKKKHAGGGRYLELLSGSAMNCTAASSARRPAGGQYRSRFSVNILPKVSSSERACDTVVLPKALDVRAHKVHLQDEERLAPLLLNSVDNPMGGERVLWRQPIQEHGRARVRPVIPRSSYSIDSTCHGM
jgi:hypothetical protein